MPYAAWVLHHEFVHALGYTAHDSTFRSLEALWPSQESSNMGPSFTEMLRKKGPLGYGFVLHAKRNILDKNLAKDAISAVYVERY